MKAPPAAPSSAAASTAPSSATGGPSRVLQQAERVGAHAEVRAVAERRQAGVAEQQVVAQREHHPDDDFERQVRVQAHARQPQRRVTQQRQRHQHRQRETGRRGCGRIAWRENPCTIAGQKRMYVPMFNHARTFVLILTRSPTPMAAPPTTTSCRTRSPRAFPRCRRSCSGSRASRWSARTSWRWTRSPRWPKRRRAALGAGPLRQRARLRRLHRHAAPVPRPPGRALGAATASASAAAPQQRRRSARPAGVLHQFVGDAVGELGHLEECIRAADLRAAVSCSRGAAASTCWRSAAPFRWPATWPTRWASSNCRTHLLDGVGGMLRESLRGIDATTCCWSPASELLARRHRRGAGLQRARRAGDRHHRQRAVAAEGAGHRVLRPGDQADRPFRSLVAPLCLAQALVVSAGHR